MKATIESTDQLVDIDGVKCRAWKGMSSGGAQFTAFIVLLRVPNAMAQGEFERELIEQPPRKI